MQLYVYRYWHPAYRNLLTLDCCAADQVHAMDSASRFLRKENARLRRARVPWRVRLPKHPKELQDASGQPKG